VVHTVHTPLHDPSPEVVRFSWGPFRGNPHRAPMFADGFDSGDTRAWTSAVSDPES
jgi:hypothetical protein